MGAHGASDTAGGASQSRTNAATAGSQQTGLFSTLFGSPTGSGGAPGTATGTSGGTLSKMADPNSLNVSSPTGPYALQYQQAKANNALGTQQAAQQINQQAQNKGFGAGAPAGFTSLLQSQNTQAGNTNAGNLFSQYAGQSYQDALNNFWKATGAEQSAMGQAGSNQNAAQGQSNQTYSQLYGQNSKNSAGQAFQNAGATALGDLGGAAGKKVGGKA